MRYESNMLWAGDLAGFQIYQDLLAKMDAAGPEAELRAQAYMQDDEDDEPFQGFGFMVEQVGSVAIMAVEGPLIPKATWLSRLFGLTAYDDIQNAAIAATEEPGIESILMAVDSPGGRVDGLSGAADTMKRIDSEIMSVSAHAGGAMQSAAMWLGSTASDISSERMSRVGSVGVIAVHMDISEHLKDRGYRPTVFTAGKYKGVGNPYEPLSASDKDIIQQELDTTHGFFIDTLSENLGLSEQHVRENIANGKTFYGEEARDLGLVDNIYTLSEVVSLLNSIDNATTPGIPGSHER